MSITVDQIERFAESRFEGLSREQLREAGKIIGADFGPNTSERTMREKLCALVGTVPASRDDAPVAAPIAKSNGKFDPKPALTPDAVRSNTWGGRRHRVHIQPQGAENENPRKYIQLTWEGVARAYPYGKQVDIPEPLYQNLIDSKKNVLIEDELLDEKGRLMKVIYHDNYLPRYNYMDLGITPGTEHLPRSLREYWLAQAAKHGNFTDLVGKGQQARRTLIQIRAELFEPVGPAFYKDLTDQDILASIHEALGIDTFAEAA